MWLLMLLLLLGAAYGARGRTRGRRLLRHGARVGGALFVAALLIALATDAHPLGLPHEDALNRTLSAIVLGLAFLVGAWMADLARGAVRARPAA